jgi:hypothetical protein
MDISFLAPSSSHTIRSPRWKQLSSKSLQSLRAHCHYLLCDSDGFYEIGPIQDCALLQYSLVVPPPSQTPPVFTTVDYVCLLAYNSCPSTCSAHDEPTRDKVVELFESLHALYSHHPLFGPCADPSILHFCHGDLHDGNILIDPTTGKITGIIDWECAGFHPWWTDVAGVGWLDEDREQFLFGANRPNKFANDKSNSLNSGSDSYLRALFHTEVHKRNPDLFSCFLGGVEMRAMLHAATDMSISVGESRIFLTIYGEVRCWDRSRRSPFPFDMMAWRRTRIMLDEMVRIFPISCFDLKSEKMIKAQMAKAQKAGTVPSAYVARNYCVDRYLNLMIQFELGSPQGKGFARQSRKMEGCFEISPILHLIGACHPPF